MLCGSALYTWAGSEDAPAFVIDVRRIPFEVIFLYGSVLAMYMGGVWFVVNIKSVHGGVIPLYGYVLCTWVWFGYFPLIFA